MHARSLGWKIPRRRLPAAAAALCTTHLLSLLLLASGIRVHHGVSTTQQQVLPATAEGPQLQTLLQLQQEQPSTGPGLVLMELAQPASSPARSPDGPLHAAAAAATAAAGATQAAASVAAAAAAAELVVARQPLLPAGPARTLEQLPSSGGGLRWEPCQDGDRLCEPRVDPWNNGSSVALCCPRATTVCSTRVDNGWPRCRMVRGPDRSVEVVCAGLRCGKKGGLAVERAGVPCLLRADDPPQPAGGGLASRTEHALACASL